MEAGRQQEQRKKKPYHYLRKYGIALDDTAASLSELEHVAADALSFIQERTGQPFCDAKNRANNKLSRYLRFPQVSSITTFLKWNFYERRMSDTESTNHSEEESNDGNTERSIIFHLIEFQSHGEQSVEDKEPIAARFWLESLQHQYPKSFKRVCLKNCYTYVKRFTPEKSYSIMDRFGIPFEKFVRMFSEDVGQWLGGIVLNSTKDDLYKFASRVPKIKFGEMVYEKPEAKPEKVCWYEIDIEDAFILDMERVLQVLINDGGDKPSYGYKTFGDEDFGIYSLLGSDHGQGASHTLLRLRLEPSKERRKVGKASYGCRTIPLISIQCKKDVTKILQKTKGVVQDAIAMLKTKHLIAVMNDANEVRCSLVPKNASLSLNEGVLYVKHGNEEQKVHYNLSQPPTSFWVVIEGSSDPLCLCDLAAGFEFQGRHGHATCKCINCDLTATEWKKPNHREGVELTLEQLKQLATADVANKVGVKSLPLWDICATKYVPPLLHIAIGICNDLYDHVVHWCLHSNIDYFSNEEQESKIQLFEMKAELQRKTDLSSSNEESELKDDLKKLKRKLYDLKKKKPYTESMKNKAAEIKSSIERLGSRKIVLEAITKRMKDLKRNIAKVKRDINDYAAKREKKSTGICVKLEDFLSANNIAIQAFFGGHMTYITLRQYMKKIDIIMMGNMSRILARIKARNTRPLTKQDADLHEALKPLSIDACKAKIQKITEIFKLLETTFGCLRIIDPTEEELLLAEKFVDDVKTAWIELELSVTPKAHLLFNHAVAASRKFGGLGDKVEEFVEEMHQHSKKQHHLVCRMSGGFEQQMHTTHRNLWVKSHPLVEREGEKVDAYKKRIFTTSGSRDPTAVMRDNNNFDRYTRVLGEDYLSNNYSL